MDKLKLRGVVTGRISSSRFIGEDVSHEVPRKKPPTTETFRFYRAQGERFCRVCERTIKEGEIYLVAPTIVYYSERRRVHDTKHQLDKALGFPPINKHSKVVGYPRKGHGCWNLCESCGEIRLRDELKHLEKMRKRGPRK